jgi:hypothetical protein
MSVCLSVRPGPETQIPKKTHTFSFQVSRNEGSVCLGTWGRGRAARAGQGQSVCLSDKQGQGRAGRCFQLRLHLQTDQVMIEFK